MPVLVLYSLFSEKQTAELQKLVNQKTFNTVYTHKVLAKIVEDNEIEAYTRKIFEECKEKETLMANPLALFYLTTEGAATFSRHIIPVILSTCRKIKCNTKRYTHMRTAENKALYNLFAKSNFEYAKSFSIVRFVKEMKEDGKCLRYKQAMELNALTIEVYSIINGVVRKHIKKNKLAGWSTANFQKMRMLDKKFAEILTVSEPGLYTLR